MAGVFVTAFYSFRMLFLAFHGEERFAAPTHARRTRARGATATTSHEQHAAHAPHGESRGSSRCR